MTRKRYIQAGVAVLVLVLLVWGISKGLERLVAPPAPTTGAAAPAPAPPAAVAHITATFFYASADGEALIPVQREVPLAEGVVPQGREILAMQLEAAPSPYLSTIPDGTLLRAFYVTERGDAFVDLSSEVSTKHRGGSFNELLTVYAIVNAVTANLPTIQRVQILIDGKEAETLAGHVDLRRPLIRDVTLVREPET
jgi:spore germination protein GerM